MARARIQAIAREFPQNSMKLLLEHPRNVRDLLSSLDVDVLDLIDFDKMTLVPTTFVQRDYRHVEADVVLRAPLRLPGQRRHITVYILIEHQSEPDRLMVFRVLEYVVQIFKAQTRTWSQKSGSLKGLRFQPVLPIVFYTGSRRWDSLGALVDLIESGERFAAVTPQLAPLFLNLPAMTPARLEKSGGFFGWVLRLVQERQARPAEFQGLLQRVVEHLEQMPEAERLRWQELLSYVYALVYHERKPAEHLELQERIEASVQAGAHFQEVSRMGKTIAQALMDKGRKKWKAEGRAEGRNEGRDEGLMEGELKALRQTLLRLLRQSYGELPAKTVATIEATTSDKQLQNWLDHVVPASSLADVGIE